MSDNAPLLENAFDLEVEEGNYALGRIDGSVPAGLRGSYYLNGPARFSRGGQRYRHWLDGDGMVCALHFGQGGDDGVRFVNRYVRGTKFSAEEEAGKALFRTFGTAFEGDRLDRGIALVSPLNVSVYPYAGTLLAFGEQGLPWELDPLTLETRGVYTFGGRLNPISPFSAHAKVAAEGDLFNFGISFSATQPSLNFYHFAADGSMVFRKRLPLDWPCSTHDFTLSRAHAVFYLSPYVMDMQAMMGGGSTLIDALKWEPERGNCLLVAGRGDGEEKARLSLGQGFCLHLVNSFEEEGLLVIDVVELDRPVYDQYQVVPDLFTEVRRAQPVRYRVDLGRGEVVQRQGLDYRHMADFPSVDPRLAGGPCDDFWMLGIGHTEQEGRKFFDELVHLRWSTGGSAGLWRAPAGHYLGGEPVFVPNPDDAGGTVICQVFDAARRHSAFLLFDAFDIAAGPVATLHLESPVHLGFHTSFAAA